MDMYRLLTMKTICVYLLTGSLCASVERGFGFHTRFRLISERLNNSEAQQMCNDLGFDGLAIVSTPEEYSYVLKKSSELRTTLGLWVGMRYDPDRATFLWDDGTVPAPDMPWMTSVSTVDLNTPCVRIYMSGSLGTCGCKLLRYAICGNHNTKSFQEVVGSTHRATKPHSIMSSPNLAEVTVKSYVQCAAFCGSHYLCRAAHFDLASNLCQVLGPNTFLGAEGSEHSVTFVRTGFIGNIVSKIFLH